MARATTPDGATLTLQEHDGEFHLKLNGRQLMSTRATASERLLARLACEGPMRPHPRLLIGGLGFGFTLRETLENAGRAATVHVAELLPQVVAWNREFLRGINGGLLDDPRVEIFEEDVFDSIRRASSSFYDAILLDVDNGPVAMVAGQNSRLYGNRGLGLIARALAPGGKAAFWSASEDLPFHKRLCETGLEVKTFDCKSHETAKRSAHRIYLAQRTGSGRG